MGLNLAGAVLCGGASSRMGTDKALVPWHGVPMAVRMADTLAAAGCRRVVAVGGDLDGLTALGVRGVPDQFPGDGPYGGVMTALGVLGAGADGVVVVSCDMPLLTPATVVALAAALEAAPADVVCAVGSTDRVQPMCAVWRPAALETLAGEYAAHERRLWRVLERHPHLLVPVPAVDVTNVNTPDDLPR